MYFQVYQFDMYPNEHYNNFGKYFTVYTSYEQKKRSQQLSDITTLNK